MRPNPSLYEINTRPFLDRLSRQHGQALSLMTVPDGEWQFLASLGFDFVWLMGVWRRSAAARREALHHPGLRIEYSSALPDWTEQDVAGSPYAVYDYSLDPALGKPEELVQLRHKLEQRGLGLILDFVPDHLARDNAWVSSHPEWFVQGSKTDTQAHPERFFSPAPGVYVAHGRDPYFPPWTDTAQVNFYSPAMRQAQIGQLLRIAEVADGARCDMAMLSLNDIFARTWGEQLKSFPRPQAEFWTEAIGQVKEKYPDFIFMAEVYWGLERELQHLGFDYTYDKGLYDRLRNSTGTEVSKYLATDHDYHSHCTHFIENHDEKRAITALGRERSLAAATVMTTTPGLHLFYDGQFEGGRLRVPVQLARQPEETADVEVKRFYERLLAVTNAPAFHQGRWDLLETTADGDESYRNLLAWSWRYEEQSKVVVINYSAAKAQAWLKAQLWGTLEITSFHDELTGGLYPHAQLGEHGLHLQFEPYQACIFDVSPKS